MVRTHTVARQKVRARIRTQNTRETKTIWHIFHEHGVPSGVLSARAHIFLRGFSLFSFFFLFARQRNINLEKSKLNPPNDREEEWHRNNNSSNNNKNILIFRINRLGALIVVRLTPPPLPATPSIKKRVLEHFFRTMIFLLFSCALLLLLCVSGWVFFPTIDWHIFVKGFSDFERLSILCKGGMNVFHISRVLTAANVTVPYVYKYKAHLSKPSKREKRSYRL